MAVSGRGFAYHGAAERANREAECRAMSARAEFAAWFVPAAQFAVRSIGHAEIPLIFQSAPIGMALAQP